MTTRVWRNMIVHTSILLNKMAILNGSLLPIHLHVPGHWILAYIDFRNKVVEVFDSWKKTPRPVVIANLKLPLRRVSKVK